MKFPIPFTRRIKNILCLLLLGTQLMVACKKSKTNAPPTPEPPISGVPVNLKGMVIDEGGKPIVGAVVKADGRQATTAANGTFVLDNVKTGEGNMLLVESVKPGYGKQIRRVAGGNGHPAITIAMSARPDVPVTFNAEAGGLAELTGGVKVDIPANAVARTDGSPYTGPVQLVVAHIDPADPNFGLKIPGGDLNAVRTDNSTAILYSYGMIDVEMTAADGQPLRLKTGKQAALRFPIAASQQAGAPATIPLWHFDETEGVWKEEGSATKNGNAYEANVSHFSTWNVDVPEKVATVKGKVTDACANNAPVKNVTVHLGQVVATTDDAGNYSARVPAGRPFEIRTGGFLSDGRSISINVPALGEGATATQDLRFPCAPGLEGRITFCTPATQLTHIHLIKDHQIVAMVQTDAQNRFKVFANHGETVTLTAFGPGDVIASKTVTMPNDNTVTQLGDIELCAPEPIPATTFTVREGAVETPYTLEGGIAQAVDNRRDRTDCMIMAGQTRLSLKIKGITAGVYPNTFVVLDLNGKVYVSETMQVTVTQYGAMGAHVAGTFSGTLRPFSGSGASIEIRNATFTVRRVLG